MTRVFVLVWMTCYLPIPRLHAILSELCFHQHSIPSLVTTQNNYCTGSNFQACSIRGAFLQQLYLMRPPSPFLSPRMARKSYFTLFSLTASIMSVLAAAGNIQTVAVGENGFRFTPDSILAPVGSVVQFEFYPFNHSVVQGDFSNPCQPLAGGMGFYSGYQVVTSGVAVSVAFFHPNQDFEK